MKETYLAELLLDKGHEVHGIKRRASQLTQVHFKLQRSEPVTTVVEQPVPPMERSALQRLLILFSGVF